MFRGLVSLFIGSALLASALAQGCDVNCQTCNTTRNICLQCAAPFYVEPTTGNCVEVSTKISNCQVYRSEDKKCEVCSTGYGGIDCARCPDNCDVCESSSVCDLCTSGYSLTADGKCTSKCTVADCRVCAVDAAVCQFCNEGMGLVDGKCQKCEVSNCASCNGDLKNCQACLLQFGGQSCSTKIEGCESVTYGSNPTCEGCIDGYYMKWDGVCYKFAGIMGLLGLWILAFLA